jgi:hypothetical protein
MKALLYIRREQLYRLFRQPLRRKMGSLLIGLVYLFVAIPLVFTNIPLLYLPLPLLIVIVIQILRQDKYLLEKTGLIPGRVILAEYIILSLPFLTAGIIAGHYFPAVLYVIIILILTITPLPGRV